MRIQHELLRRSFIEVFVTLNSLFQFYDGDVDRLGDFDLVVQDRHHQLTVVLQHGTLASGKGMRFSPSQADTDTEISMLRSLVHSPGVIGYVQTGNAESAAGTANRHQRIQYRGGCFRFRVLAVAAGFEANAIHRAIHLGNFEDLGNLVADGGSFRDIHDLAPETLRLRQAFGDEVANNHDRGSEQLAGSRAGEPDR